MHRIDKDYGRHVTWVRKLTIRVALGIVALTAAATLIMLWRSDRPTPLVSVNSGKCVSIVDGDIEEARVFQLDCTGQPDRMWYLRKIVEDGVGGAPYHIVNVSSGKCLSVSDQMFAGAEVVVQRSCVEDKEKGQLWIFDIDKDRGNGWIYGQLINMQGWSCLDINGGDIADGTPVIEWGCGQQSNQRFRVPKEVID